MSRPNRSSSDGSSSRQGGAGTPAPAAVASPPTAAPGQQPHSSSNVLDIDGVFRQQQQQHSSSNVLDIDGVFRQQQQQHSSSNVLDIDGVFIPRAADGYTADGYIGAQEERAHAAALAAAAAAASRSPLLAQHQQAEQQQQQGAAGASSSGSGSGGVSPPQRSNELAVDDIGFEDFATPLLSVEEQEAARQHKEQQQQQVPLPRLLLGSRPLEGGAGMADFPSGSLDLVQHLNLDGIFMDGQGSITHDAGPVQQATPQQRQQQQAEQQPPSPPAGKEQQRQQRHRQAAGTGPDKSSSRAHGSSRSRRQQQQPEQQQQQQELPQLRTSQPRPHPLYFKPRHVKRHFKVTTVDGWRLHLIRTQVLNVPPTQHHPIILCPGLGSSGAYSFDLSPNVSLADYLASKGWDVWTCELRGNGASDKPALFSSRSRWWTIDDYVEKDVPAIIRFVCKETKALQVHFLGHSMGGMILCGVMARVDITTARIRSCICMGSGLFMEDSWWRLFDRFRFLLHTLWVVPSGVLLRAYSRLMFGPYAIPYIDALYFWSSNVDHRVGRAMMRRNFSNLSVGVLQQISSAFGPKGLLSSDKRMVYADASRLSKVTAPALFLVGDRDRMCPPDGCKRTFQMLGSPDKRYVCLGPASGFSDHYGHFDILMGKRVEVEVFPLIHQFLLQHDSLRPRM